VDNVEFPYRMRDLVRLTGLSAATIQFYRLQDLLPDMKKTSSNQAAYPEATLQRLRWIRSVQVEMSLTLRGIKGILEQNGELPIPEIRTLQILGQMLEGRQPGAAAGRLSAVEKDLAPGDLEGLRSLGLIRLGNDISPADVRLLELIAAARAMGFRPEAGFPIESIGLYKEAVERLLQKELRRFVHPALKRKTPEGLRDLITAGLPLVHQLFAVLHERALQSEIEHWLQLSADVAEEASA